MFVNSLLCYEESKCKDGEIQWNEIEDAIRKLDGKKFNEVSISKRSTEAHMSITGGSGNYLISATLDNDVFWDVCSPGASGEPIKLVSGGQTVTVEKEEVVSLDTALAIAKYFSEEGKILTSYSWRKNPPD